MGKRTAWTLSHALFSHDSIDAGTHLLLKTIAQHLPLESCSSLLDTGCGVGILGGAVKKRFPGIEISLQDRDALALHFSQENLERNGLDFNKLISGLLLHNVNRRFDLIVSNIPAKAGIPVLDEFIRKIPGYLNPGGKAAIVVISALSVIIRNMIISSHCTISWEEHTQRYSVFHFSAEERETEEMDFSRYIRGSFPFQAKKVRYELESVYDLDDFDTFSWTIKTFHSALEKTAIEGPCAVYNPGQGHIPVYLAKKRGPGKTPPSLYSRDLLQLLASERNLAAIGHASHCHHVPFPSPETQSGSRKFGCIAVVLEKIPGVHPGEFWPWIGSILAPGGTAVFTGLAALIHSVREKRPSGYIMDGTAKMKGRACIVFRKN